MILRNNAHPRGIDVGPAINAFSVGSGGSRAKYRVANHLYGGSNASRRTSRPEQVALIGAIVTQALADARTELFARDVLVGMIPFFRLSTEWPEEVPVVLAEVAEWMQHDAASWLTEVGVQADRIDPTEMADATAALRRHLMTEPLIQRVA